MTTAQVGYEPVHCWVKHILGRTHPTVVGTVAWAVLRVLVAQRVTPAAVARALPAEHAGSGRACLRRVRRWWCGHQLFADPGYEWGDWLAQQWASLARPVAATSATPLPELAFAEAA